VNHAIGPLLAAALATALSLAACNQTNTQDAGLDEQPTLEQPGGENPGGQQPPGTNDSPGGDDTSPPSGSLDGSFGTEGVLIASLPQSFGREYPSVAQHAIPDFEGRLIVTGTVRNQDDDVAVARYRTDGSLDPGFGTSGVSVMWATHPNGAPDNWRSGDASLPLADGGLLAVGSTPYMSHAGSSLHHLLEDGTHDSYFGGGTTGSLAGSGKITDLALQPDGKVLLAYWRELGGFAHVTRLLPDGKPDPGFGEGGAAIIDVDPASGTVESSVLVARAPGGKVVAITYAQAAGERDGYGNYWVARLNSDGTLDPSFDGDGIAPLTFGARTRSGPPSAVAVDSQGGVYVSAILQPANGEFLHAAGITRLTPSGAVDQGFASEGVFTAPTIATGSISMGRELALDSAGRVLLGVVGVPDSNEEGILTLLRLTSDGEPDQSFSVDGRVDLPLAAPVGLSTVTVGAVGRITVTGFLRESSSGPRDRVVAARVNP
jgi:uncharacterized delta-60 repeat protein